MIRKPNSREELIRMLDEHAKIKQELKDKAIGADIQQGQFTKLLAEQYDPITKAISAQTTDISKQTEDQTRALRTILNKQTVDLLASNTASRNQQVAAIKEVRTAVNNAIKLLAKGNATAADIQKATEAIVNMFKTNPYATSQDIQDLVATIPSMAVDSGKLAVAIADAVSGASGAMTLQGKLADMGITWIPDPATGKTTQVIEKNGLRTINGNAFNYDQGTKLIAVAGHGTIPANKATLRLYFSSDLTDEQAKRAGLQALEHYENAVAGGNNGSSSKVKAVKAAIQALKAASSSTSPPTSSWVSSPTSSSASSSVSPSASSSVSLPSTGPNPDSTILTSSPAVPDPATTVPIVGSGLPPASQDIQELAARYLPVGKWKMDIDAAAQGLLKMFNTAGKQMMSAKPDPTFWKLLTERYNPKFAYSPKAQELFKRVVKGSGLQLPQRSLKRRLVDAYQPAQSGGCTAVPYSGPDQLLERLQVLLGSSAAGNHKNPHLLNEATAILDHLKGLGAINDRQYKAIWKKFGGF